MSSQDSRGGVRTRSASRSRQPSPNFTRGRSSATSGVVIRSRSNSRTTRPLPTTRTAHSPIVEEANVSGSSTITANIAQSNVVAQPTNTAQSNDGVQPADFIQAISEPTPLHAHSGQSISIPNQPTLSVSSQPADLSAAGRLPSSFDNIPTSYRKGKDFIPPSPLVHAPFEAHGPAQGGQFPDSSLGPAQGGQFNHFSSGLPQAPVHGGHMNPFSHPYPHYGGVPYPPPFYGGGPPFGYGAPAHFPPYPLGSSQDPRLQITSLLQNHFGGSVPPHLSQFLETSAAPPSQQVVSPHFRSPPVSNQRASSVIDYYRNECPHSVNDSLPNQPQGFSLEGCLLNLANGMASSPVSIQTSSHPLYPVILATTKGSFPTFPTIPLLSKPSEFTAWDKGIHDVLSYYSVTGWVLDVDETASMVDHRRASFPMPHGHPGSDEEVISCLWDRIDKFARLVISSKVSSEALQSIRPASHTARDLYRAVKKRFWKKDFSFGGAQWASAKAMTCGTTCDAIDGYLARYEKYINEVVSSDYVVSAHDIIQHFLLQLPNTQDFSYLLSDFRRDCHSGRRPPNDDWTCVFDWLDRARTAAHDFRARHPPVPQNRNRDVSRISHPPGPPRPGPRPNNQQSSTSLTPNNPLRPSSSTNQPRSSTSKPQAPGLRTAAVQCSNCDRTGHTAENCYAPGGGLDRTKTSAYYAGDYAAADGGGLNDEDREVIDAVCEADDADGGGHGLDDVGFLANSFSSFKVNVPSGTSFNGDYDFAAYYSPEPVKHVSGNSSSSTHPPASILPPSPSSIRDTIVYDSGAGQHVFNSRSCFETFSPLRKEIGTAGTSALIAKGIGVVSFKVRLTNGDILTIMLRDVLFAPDCPVSLLSLGRMTNIEGFRFLFGTGRTIAWKTVPKGERPTQFFTIPRFGYLTACRHDIVRVSPDLRHDVFLLASVFALGPGAKELPPTFVKADETKDVHLWHKRLGHPGRDTTKAVLTTSVVKGVTFSGKLEHTHCVSCVLGYHPQRPYPYRGNRAERSGDLVHIDIAGPWPVATPEGKKYFIAFLDDSPHHGYGFLARHKSETYDFYILVEARIKNKTGRDVGSCHFDNAKEFVQGRLAAHLRSKGTKIRNSAPYAHQSNGKIERYLRLIQDRALALMAESGLPPSFWGYAILYAVYITNRLPTSTLPDGVTPHEASEGVKPDISNLRVFGCRCFPVIPTELRRKGDFRRYEAIFIGIGNDSSNWKVMDLTGKIHISGDVLFDECTMGRLSSRRHGLSPHSSSADLLDAQSIVDRIPPFVPRRSPRGHTNSPPVDGLDNVLRRSSRHLSSTVAFADNFAPSHYHSAFEGTSVVFLTGDAIDLELSRANFEVSNDDEDMAYLFGIGCQRILDDEEGVMKDDVSGVRDSDLFFSSSRSLLDSFLSFDDFLLLTSPSLTTAGKGTADPGYSPNRPPRNLKEAMRRPDWPSWRAAMEREHDSLLEKRAFVPVERPEGVVPLRLLWVFDFKYDEKGNIRWGMEKARVVVMGNYQGKGTFDETYAPVAKLASVRIILGLTAQRDYELFSFDIKTAFLHSVLKDEVYIQQIPGFPLSDPAQVLKLRVALYGLRQAAFAWYCHILKVIIGIGLKRSDYDHAVFIGVWQSPPHPSVIMPSDGSALVLIVPLHVDDGLGSTNSPSLYAWFITQLHANGIQVKDFGPVSLFLGMTIIRDRPTRRLWLSQAPYLKKILEDYNMVNCNSVKTPMEKYPWELEKVETVEGVVDLTKEYQVLIGLLIWLATCTRPDISFAVMSLGRYNAHPEPRHFKAAKHILRYLAGTRHLALCFDSNLDIHSSVNNYIRSATGFTDADWASDSVTRISVSGYAFYYGGGLVSWTSARQRVIALSSTEAEFYAVALGVKEALWMRRFLISGGFPVPSPFPLLCDNQSTIHQVDSPAISSRSKHIHIRELFIKQFFSDGSFSSAWVPTSANVADIFTKPLKKTLFLQHRDALGLSVPPSS